MTYEPPPPREPVPWPPRPKDPSPWTQPREQQVSPSADEPETASTVTEEPMLPFEDPAISDGRDDRAQPTDQTVVEQTTVAEPPPVEPPPVEPPPVEPPPVEPPPVEPPPVEPTAEPEIASPVAQPGEDVYAETSLREDVQRAWRNSAVGSLPGKTLARLIALAVLIVFICTAAGVGLVLLRPAPASARVDILYDSPPTSASSTQLDREFATQVEIMRGRSVLGPVATTERTSIETLEEALSVQVVPGTEVLRVTVSHREAERARTLAQRLAETYIGVVTIGSGVGEQDTEVLEKDLAAAEDDYDDAKEAADEAAEDGNQSAANRFETRAARLLQTVGTLRGQLASLPEERNREAQPRIVVPAYVLKSTIVPRSIRGGASGMLIGLLFAGLLTAGLVRNLKE